MKRFAWPLLGLLGALVATSAHAVEIYIGTTVSTTSKTNGNTASTYTIGKFSRVIVQCDVAVYVEWVSSTSGTTSSTTGLELAAKEKWETYAGGDFQYLAQIATAGSGTTATCKTFRVYSP